MMHALEGTRKTNENKVEMMYILFEICEIL